MFVIPSYYAARESRSLVVWFDLAITFVYIFTLLGSIYITITSKHEARINSFIRYFILLMVIVAISRVYESLTNPRQLGSIYFSVVLMLFYAFINFFMCMWTKREAIIFKSKTTLMQSRIFAMKFYLKIIILFSLIGSYIFADRAWSLYLDSIGCVFFAAIALLNYRSLKLPAN